MKRCVAWLLSPAPEGAAADLILQWLAFMLFLLVATLGSQA